MTKYHKLACVTTLVIIITMLFVSIQPANAKFAIAGSNFPDEYDQGIEVLFLYENSTGSWEPILDPASLIFPRDNHLTVIDMNYNASTAIKLLIGCNINHTQHDLSTHQEALNIMRVNIVMTNAGTVVFSQDNVTWDGLTIWDDTDTTWQVFYEVVIEVLIVSGGIYAVTITYEIFY